MIVSKLSAPMLVINDALVTTRSPVMVCTLPMLMSSVVPVAMAMLPVKVLQDARAVASPEFWMVVVPEILHDATENESVRWFYDESSS